MHELVHDCMFKRMDAEAQDALFFSIIYVYTFDCAVYIVSLLEPGHRCAHIDDLAFIPPHADRALIDVNVTLM